MRVIGLALALTASALIAGCAGGSGSNDFINVPLQPGPQNLGNIGQAGLTAQGEITGVNIFLGGVPANVTRPLQVYTFIYSGRCGQLSATPAFALNAEVQSNVGDNGWYLTKRLPLSLNALRAGPYALVLRSSPADRNLELFCGDIQ